MSRSSLSFALVALGATSCFFLPPQSPQSGVPFGMADGGLADGGQSADAGLVACGNAAAPVFPSFDASCVSGADCTFGLHQTDCCDAERALAINRDQIRAFALAEESCEAMFPSCDCFRWPGITTDDGKNVMSASDVGVDCVGGSCRSFAISSP